MIGMTLFFMNIIAGNITLVIDPLEKAIGYKEALFLFWPVLAATGNLHKLCQLLDYGQEMMDVVKRTFISTFQGGIGFLLASIPAKSLIAEDQSEEAPTK